MSIAPPPTPVSISPAQSPTPLAHPPSDSPFRSDGHTEPITSVLVIDSDTKRPRSDSSSTMRKVVVRTDTAADLTPRGRTRRSSSFSGIDVKVQSERGSHLDVPARPTCPRSASATELRPDVALASTSSRSAGGSVGTALDGLVTLKVGPNHKVFQVDKDLLMSKCRYFATLLSATRRPAPEDLVFDQLDEFGFALFVRWLYANHLYGPQDFHGFQNYLALYVLGLKFDIEVLCNLVMNLCRGYYRRNGMTAPAYRLEYIYAVTDRPNPMRRFLMETAAFRCLCDGPVASGSNMSDTIRELISKGGTIAIDLAEALIVLSKNGTEDVRKKPDCKYHEHVTSKMCEEVPVEAYMAE